MPPAGGFAAKLLSGVLDGWTARHQQGLAQQREDELSQQQFAQRQQLDEQQYGRQLDLEDVRLKGRKELTEISNMFDMLKSEVEHGYRMDEISARAKGDIDKLLASFKLKPTKDEKPPKPLDPRKIEQAIGIYGGGSPAWTTSNMADLVTYIKRNVPAGEDVTPDHFDEAKRVVQGRNAAFSVADAQSGIPQMFSQIEDRNLADKFIPAQEAVAVLANYGLLESPLIDKDYSVPELVEAVVSGSQDPLKYQKANVPMEEQPLGLLMMAIQEILMDYLPPPTAGQKFTKEAQSFGERTRGTLKF
jgi:hypothetical protein